MKNKLLRTVLLLVIGVIIASKVSAMENKLYFTDSGNRLNYDSALYDNTFIKHDDMLPGRTYEDTISIENGTKKAYPLYLKVKEADRTTLVKELLDNIIMEIFIGERLVYSGYASGLDYEYKDKMIRDAIYLGSYKSGEKETLKVVTTLKADYSNKSNNALASVDWEFYTLYDDSIETINPNTKNNLSYTTFIIFIISFTVLMITFLWKMKRSSSLS